MRRPIVLAPPPEAAASVVRRLQAAGYEAWLVGGGVRDRLLGRPVNDWDVATDALPEAVQALFPRAIGTGLQHGTVTVVHEGLPVEVTTYRVEVGYQDGRHPDQVFFTRILEDDLSRRDFTINAMAWDPEAGVLCDPFGGEADLARGVLRAVGVPLERLREDGLRTMRAVRLATTLALQLDLATEAAIPQALDVLRKVAVERIRVELEKLLLAPKAGGGLRILSRTALLPEVLSPLAGLCAADLERTARAVEATPPRLEPRLAALLWATGDAEAWLDHMRFSKAAARAVRQLLSLRALAPTAADPPARLRAAVAAVTRETWPDWVVVQRAWAAAPEAWDALADRVAQLKILEGPLTVRELALDGRAVAEALGIPPSRRVGRLLEALLGRVFADPGCNTPAGLCAALPAVDAALDEPPEGAQG